MAVDPWHRHLNEVERAMVGANTSTQYLDTSTSTLKMFKYKYKYKVLRNVLGYYRSTLQMYLGTITKYQVQMYNITHKIYR